MSTAKIPALNPLTAGAHGKDAARGVTMKCQEKYCPPNYQIQVDTPKNTLARDDSLTIGLGTLQERAEAHEKRRHIHAIGERQSSAVTNRLNFQVVDNTALGKVYDSIKSQYYKEAHEHPGVRLVAHTVS